MVENHRWANQDVNKNRFAKAFLMLWAKSSKLMSDDNLDRRTVLSLLNDMIDILESLKESYLKQN